MTTNQAIRKSKGYGVYVVCEIRHIVGVVAEVWFRDSGRVINTKADELAHHPTTRSNLCRARLLGTDKNLAVVRVRRVEDESIELNVSKGRVYFVVRGRLFPFHSWEELIQVRTKQSRQSGSVAFY